MRERAEVAQGAGGWIAPKGDSFVFATDAEGEIDSLVIDASDEDAEHIASWGPSVALVVADWLDAEADEQEVLGSPDEPNVTPAGTRAYSVARAYLGETA
jgi:hypothetical protein